MRFFEAIHDVYFDDLDALQILHNAKYLLLFERTIGAFWARTMGWDRVLDQTKNPDRVHLVRANNVEYLRPVSELGQVRVRIWIEKLGRTSLTFAMRILPMEEDVDHARGTRVLVSVDPATRRPAPWSDELRARVAPYVAAGEAG
ncbi:MAG: acyl-CoA thioesterase [Labilithrix sp.]|nr:acyl-CoA thioesterase [Labilithrix sp.]MCW5817871.1 acyl-CoA thioesterase [Labilithrix sp.]